MKKIVITGATGSIGRRLVQQLTARGDEVIIFTRNTKRAEEKIRNGVSLVKWNYSNPGEWEEHLFGVDSVVHLAGANLSSRRWNERYKKIAYESRVISTRNLVEAINSLDKKPKTFICANAVGIYGDKYDEVLDEKSLPANNFLADLCRDWEAEAEKVEQLGVRRVSVRTGLVLDKNEGLIKKLVPSFKMFLGGWLGNGKQWFPWIHIDDIVGIYQHAVDNKNINGSINVASPGIVTNKEFSKTLGKVLSRPAFLPVPKIALRIISGELGNYVTDSQRINVDKILNYGYKIKFEKLEEALTDLLK
jgi:uncharacterized protein